MKKNYEQDALENNKRDEKEKVTKENEDRWIKPLKCVPIAHFYKIGNKCIETSVNK